MKIELQEMLDELEKLTKRMDVPSFRRRNVTWLHKNLKIRNNDSEHYPQAAGIITELLSNGVARG